jgi:23S rRNA (cytidine1920-2'-O)/16S rRNA (cytidine1409-2'-O)-methyltransferase
VQAFVRAELPGAQEIGAIDSPIAGADGNREFLLGLRRATSF